MNEEWLTYPNDSRYEVSSMGRVRSIYSKHVRKPVPIKSGYLTLLFSVPGHKSILRYIHKMVLETFVGECPKGLEVSHIDGSKDNCELTNLIYETKFENHERRHDHGTDHIGSMNPAAVLSKDQVDEIRLILQNNSTLTYKAIGILFGVSPSQIFKIKHNINWRT